MTLRHQKAYRLRQLRGESPFTDAAPIRRHLDGLIGAGWSIRAIAGAASCSPTQVSRVLLGKQKRLTNAVAFRLASIRPGTLPVQPSSQVTEPFVPKVGAVRRIQALLWMGWTHQGMREHSGVRTAVILNQQGRWITRTNHDKIAAMFAELAMREGPSAKTRGRARALGYNGPLAWDDIDHDEAPRSDADLEVTDFEEYDFLIRSGESHDRALARLGVTQSAWEKRLERRPVST